MGHAPGPWRLGRGLPVRLLRLATAQSAAVKRPGDPPTWIAADRLDERVSRSGARAAARACGAARTGVGSLNHTIGGGQICPAMQRLVLATPHRRLRGREIWSKPHAGCLSRALTR